MNGKKKTKYIAAVTAILLAACLAAVTGVFAWMTNTKTISKIGFQISQVSCSIKMYEGLENDYNGVPDLLGVGLGAQGATATYNDSGEVTAYGQYRETDSKTWTNYTEKNIYYGEKYAFKLLGSKSMLSSESTTNTFESITLENAEPSRVYVYKFSVANEEGGSAGYLSFGFDSAAASKTTTLDASAFQCRMWRVVKGDDGITYRKYQVTEQDPDGNIIETTEWFDLAAGGTSLESDVFIGDTKKTNNLMDMVDIWLQIRMNPKITNKDSDGRYVTADIFGQDVTLPNFKITFSTSKSS